MRQGCAQASRRNCNCVPAPGKPELSTGRCRAMTCHAELSSRLPQQGPLSHMLVLLSCSCLVLARVEAPASRGLAYLYKRTCRKVLRLPIILLPDEGRS